METEEGNERSEPADSRSYKAFLLFLVGDRVIEPEEEKFSGRPHIHSHSDAGMLKIQLPIPVFDLEPEAHTVWCFIIFLQT